MLIAVTGYWSGKLYGYSLSTPEYTILKEKFKTILKKYKATTAYTGMALGTDTVFANAVLDLKKKGWISSFKIYSIFVMINYKIGGNTYGKMDTSKQWKISTR